MIAAGRWAAALALSVVAPARAETVVVGEREPALVLVLSAAGVGGSAATGPVLDLVAELVHAHTNLKPLTAEQVGLELGELDQCRVDQLTTCWALAARRDAVGLRDAGFSAAAHRASFAASKLPPRLLFVVTVAPAKAGAKLSAFLIDTDWALDLVARAMAEPGDWREPAEARVFASAIVTELTLVERLDRASLEPTVLGWLTRDFRPTLERGGNLTPPVDLTVHADRPGVVVELDGVTVGRTGEGPLVLADLRPGSRRVTLVGPDGGRVEHQVALGDGPVTLRFDGPREAHVLRRPTFWAGIGLAVGGAALLSIAAAQAADDVAIGCVRLGPGGGECPRLGFVSSGYDPSRAPTLDVASLDAGGLALVPLGAGLVATGAAWSLGAELEAPERPPWIELGVGLAAGLLTYGVVALVR